VVLAYTFIPIFAFTERPIMADLSRDNVEGDRSHNFYVYVYVCLCVCAVVLGSSFLVMHQPRWLVHFTR
jgi:hypothetical protein